MLENLPSVTQTGFNQFMALSNYKNRVKHKMLTSKTNSVSGPKLADCIRKARYLISSDFSKIIFISLKHL